MTKPMVKKVSRNPLLILTLVIREVIVAYLTKQPVRIELTITFKK